MFAKDEAKISSRVKGVKWRVVDFDTLVFESDDQEFSLREVKSKTISSHPGKDGVHEHFEGEICSSHDHS